MKLHIFLNNPEAAPIHWSGSLSEHQEDISLKQREYPEIFSGVWVRVVSPTWKALDVPIEEFLEWETVPEELR